MAFRTHESPMDFAWEQAGGPMNLDSEFQRAINRNDVQRDNVVKKRPHSVLESPNKPQSVLSLRDPATPGQTMLFNTAPPTTPFVKPNNLAFSIPRKFETDFCSSGPENDSSPDQHADSEATPDGEFRSAVNKTRFGANQQFSANPDKQCTVFNRSVVSPGRGEIARSNYSNAIEKRVLKKRRRDGERRLLRQKLKSEPDSDDELAQERRTDKGSKSSQSGTSSAASVFSFIETHPDLPHILSFYAQLLLNVFLVFFFIYIIYSFWSTIRSDVDKKSEEAIADILAEMAKCAQSYRDNFCEKENRAPALMTACDNWELCMNKNPQAVGRARVSAHTFAEIFNSFIEPISYKAMIFSLILVFGCVAVSNFAFGFFRNRAHPPPPPPSSYMQGPHQRYPGDTPRFWTPYQSHMALEPNPSMDALGMQTPIRRLQY